MTDRTQLADLVRSRREELRLSYQSLAAAAVDPGSETSVSSGWLHRLESGKPVIAPSFEALRALAAGLRVPLAKVQRAAGAQFFGIEPTPGISVEAMELVELAGRLTAEQRDALIGLLDVLPTRVSE